MLMAKRTELATTQLKTQWSGPHPARVVWADLAISAFLLTATASLHFLTGPAVLSGSDPGNWLAFAHEARGEPVMSADATYPPLFPFLVAILIPVADSLSALTISALLAKSVLVLAVYWSTRQGSRSAGVVAATLILTAAYQLEAYAFGAYPQLLATGFGVVVVWLALRFISEHRRTYLVLILLGSTMIFATHKLIAGLLLLALPVAIAHKLWIAKIPLRQWGTAVKPIGALLIPGAFFLAFWLAEARTGVRPVLNPLDLSFPEQLGKTVAEAPVSWAAIALIGLVASVRRTWAPASVNAVSAGTAWIVASFGFFLVTAEQRALLVAQVGLITIAAVAFFEFRQRTRSAAFSPTMLTALGIALLGWTVVTGISHYTQVTDYYLVVDSSDLEILNHLREASSPGDLVIASHGRNGNPIGWWIEGYAERPTYSAMDTRYVAFPDEKRQAELANRIFRGGLTPGEFAPLMKAIGARFVVVDTRGPDAVWLERSDDYNLTPLVESTSLVVLTVP